MRCLILKKMMILFVCVLMLFSMVACSGNPDDGTNLNEDMPPSSATGAPTAPLQSTNSPDETENTPDMGATQSPSVPNGTSSLKPDSTLTPANTPKQ